jgi:GNAT superfamily N-acetyltransferase
MKLQSSTQPSTPHVRPATPADATELSRLVNSAYRGDSSRRGWTTEADLLDGQRTDPDTLEQDLSRPGVTILCLRESESGPILACVSLELFDDARGKGCHLGMLTVNPTLQAQGLGKILMQRSEAFARSRGAARMRLGVIQLREQLMQWYERRGYERTGETRPFPYGDEKWGLPRQADLHFVLFEKALR